MKLQRPTLETLAAHCAPRCGGLTCVDDPQVPLAGSWDDTGTASADVFWLGEDLAKALAARDPQSQQQAFDALLDDLLQEAPPPPWASEFQLPRTRAAVQAHTLKDIAKLLGVVPETVARWRTNYSGGMAPLRQLQLLAVDRLRSPLMHPWSEKHFKHIRHSEVCDAKLAKYLQRAVEDGHAEQRTVDAAVAKLRQLHRALPGDASARVSALGAVVDQTLSRVLSTPVAAVSDDGIVEFSWGSPRSGPLVTLEVFPALKDPPQDPTFEWFAQSADGDLSEPRDWVEVGKALEFARRPQ